MYKILTLFFLLLMPLVTVSSDYAGRPEVQEFVRELAEEGDFDERELLSIFSHAEYKQSIMPVRANL